MFDIEVEIITFDFQVQDIDSGLQELDEINCSTFGGAYIHTYTLTYIYYLLRQDSLLQPATYYSVAYGYLVISLQFWPPLFKGWIELSTGYELDRKQDFRCSQLSVLQRSSL